MPLCWPCFPTAPDVTHPICSWVHILQNVSLKQSSVNVCCLTSYLKTQQLKITNINLAHNSVGKRFGLDSAGLIHASTVSWQSKTSFTRLEIGRLADGMREELDHMSFITQQTGYRVIRSSNRSKRRQTPICKPSFKLLLAVTSHVDSLAKSSNMAKPRVNAQGTIKEYRNKKSWISQKSQLHQPTMKLLFFLRIFSPHLALLY